ncbi:conserved hypothetical protein [Mesorhizobium prunaredense]|uniref:Uncharacterized protein n=1 Tax=Mesorhizobium prunaredense TaxID=1631249 RepID=A0A1R3V6E8_9HYPH|nr:hypothetical protein [Mesorhizobium prunaredense]SIT55431.1 conserved hypothetical protein [Mesorhizobium prunaredense]
MVLIDLGNYPLKGLDCTPRYLNMSGRGVDFSLARLDAPNAGFPCVGIGDKPALIFNGDYHVKCKRCGAQGPTADTWAEAERLWNDRDGSDKH